LVTTCRKVPELSLGAALATAGRPLVASLVMAACVLAWDHGGPTGPILVLALKVITGAVVYTALALLFWRLAGRPDGIESLVLDGIKSLKGRVFARLSRTPGA
jgi:hypothetical protein